MIRPDLIELFRVPPGKKKIRLHDDAPGWAQTKEMKRLGKDTVKERAHWDTYMEAYESALAATSTKWAPWYVVPADHKWVTRAVVADVITSTIQGLGLRFPEVSKEQREALKAARKRLSEE